MQKKGNCKKTHFCYTFEKQLAGVFHFLLSKQRQKKGNRKKTLFTHALSGLKRKPLLISFSTMRKKVSKERIAFVIYPHANLPFSLSFVQTATKESETKEKRLMLRLT